MGAPVVDIILATNRRSPFLPATLASVQAQTWTTWRLTVIDDGSPCPGDIVEAVSGIPRSVVLRRPAAGLAAARNVGIGQTVGDLLVFLDDDDLWEPTKLATQVAALEADAEAIGSYTGGYHIDGDGLEIGHRWPAQSGSANQLRRLDVELPRITTLMVRRAAVGATGGFDERYSSAEDIAFALDLTRIGRLVAIDLPLTAYRRHTTNMTVSIPTMRQNRIQEQVWRDRIASARRAGQTDEAKALATGLARVRSRSAADVLPRARHAVERGDYAAAAGDLWWSTSRAPGSVVRGAVRRVRGQ